MKTDPSLVALKEQLEALPDWSPEELPAEKTVVLSIDMNQGFTKEGPLSSPRVEKILPETAGFLPVE